MPFDEALPIPAKYPSGTEMTSAHGHEITRKIRPLCTHVPKSKPVNRGGISDIITAASTTMGV